MCHIAEEIIKELEGLKFSFLNEGKESIATTNGEANFDEIKEKIRAILLKKKGELIELEGIGGITDLGQKEAEIEMGYYAEFYCYDCMSATFIRLWKERALFMEKEWVSVDIDEISDSLWFR